MIRLAVPGCRFLGAAFTKFPIIINFTMLSDHMTRAQIVD